MSWVDFFAVLNIFAALVCVAAAMLAWRYPDIRAARAVGWMFIFIAIWTATEGLILFVPDATTKYNILYFQYAAAALIPLVWLAVARAVTGANKHTTWWWLPTGLTSLNVLLAATNTWHHLILQAASMPAQKRFPTLQYGSLFPAYALSSYVMLFYGAYLIWLSSRAARGVWRFELRLWLWCVGLPLIVDLASLFQELSLGDIRLTPLALTLTVSLATWGLLRHRIFRVQPVALEAAFQSMRDGIVITDAKWRIAQVNAAASPNPQDWIGEPIHSRLAAWQADPPLNTGIEISHNNRILEYTTNAIASGGYVITIRDLTALRHYQHQLREAAMRDPLTGLYNRRAFLEHATQQLESAQAFSLVYLDLDRFKQVNDSLGHEGGDELLMLLSKRYQTFLGKHLLARVGGDEFVVLLPNPVQLETIMAQLEALITEPAEIQQQTVQVGLSWGVASYPEDGEELELLLRVADNRMYALKKARRA